MQLLINFLQKSVDCFTLHSRNRVHALKFQSVLTPNELISKLFGLVEGRLRDSDILHLCRLQQLINTPNGDPEGLYCHIPYPLIFRYPTWGIFLHAYIRHLNYFLPLCYYLFHLNYFLPYATIYFFVFQYSAVIAVEH